MNEAVPVTISGSSALSADLHAALAVLPLALTTPQEAQLLQFLALLHRWNRVYNLTSVREVRDMLAVHVLDSLAVLPVVDRYVGRGSVLDVGSGAGLPGIPLGIARPDWRVITVDAVAKKIAFQTQVKAALDLANLTPIHHRVEALTLPEMPGVVVARAYSSLVDFVASVDRLAGASTTLVAMKAQVADAEIQAVLPPWRSVEIVPLAVPRLGAPRCAVVLRRDA